MTAAPGHTARLCKKAGRSSRPCSSPSESVEIVFMSTAEAVEYVRVLREKNAAAATVPRALLPPFRKMNLLMNPTNRPMNAAPAPATTRVKRKQRMHHKHHESRRNPRARKMPTCFEYCKAAAEAFAHTASSTSREHTAVANAWGESTCASPHANQQLLLTLVPVQ